MGPSVGGREPTTPLPRPVLPPPPFATRHLPPDLPPLPLLSASLLAGRRTSKRLSPNAFPSLHAPQATNYVDICFDLTGWNHDIVGIEAHIENNAPAGSDLVHHFTM